MLFLQLIVTFRVFVSRIVSLIVFLIIQILGIFNRTIKLYRHLYHEHVIP